MLIKNLEKRYKDFHLFVPYWEWSDTGVTALVGPSGSGKTTLFQILLGLAEADHPFVWDFKGENLAALSVRERRLGIVFQEDRLFPHLSAIENCLFAYRARNTVMDKERLGQARERVGELFERLDLSGFERRRVSELSGEKNSECPW